MKLTRVAIIILILLASFISYSQEPTLNVVVTTSIIADVAQNVGGEQVDITSLVPSSADVHAFQPNPADIVLVQDADLLLVNGAGLEVFLGDILANTSDSQVSVVSNGVIILPFGNHVNNDEDKHQSPEILGEDTNCGDEHDHDDEHEHGSCDPHVWLSVANVKIWVDNIASAFASADPDNSDIYRDNANDYLEQLDQLDSDIRERVETLPTESRILVTNHDFMRYYAHEYGFTIVDTVIAGGTTIAEPSPQEIASLVELVRESGVNVIFTEVSSDSRLTRAISEEAGVNVVVDLYSGSLSETENEASTYIDMMHFNTQLIVNALSQ